MSLCGCVSAKRKYLLKHDVSKPLCASEEGVYCLCLVLGVSLSVTTTMVDVNRWILESLPWTVSQVNVHTHTRVALTVNVLLS